MNLFNFFRKKKEDLKHREPKKMMSYNKLLNKDSINTEEYLFMTEYDINYHQRAKVGFYEKSREQDRLKMLNDKASLQKLIEFLDDEYIPTVFGAADALLEFDIAIVENDISKGINKVQNFANSLEKRMSLYRPFDEETSELLEMEWLDYIDSIEDLKTKFEAKRKTK